MSEAGTILVIDDDPFSRFTITAFLEDCGYLLLEAGNGEEGLATFRGTPVDLVITDLHMPGLDGTGVLAALKDLSPGTPVIMFTGTGDPRDVQAALAAGARACLFKPLQRMATLTEAIEAELNDQG